MLDPSEKRLESEEMKRKYPSDASSKESQASSNNSSSNNNETRKTCADCGTTKTPLWRGGPAGPKSLCNACGIRSRKKRRAILGGGSEEKKPRRSHHNHNNNNNHSSSSSGNSGHNKLGDSLKQRLLALGREVMMQRSKLEKPRRKLGEEEQAAVLLMALSYGSVYA